MKKSQTCSGTQIKNTHRRLLTDMIYESKEGSLYLSRVFVLTIRHLQHSVYLDIVGVKGLLFHLRDRKGGKKGKNKPLVPTHHLESDTSIAAVSTERVKIKKKRKILIYAHRCACPHKQNTESQLNIHAHTHTTSR